MLTYILENLVTIPQHMSNEKYKDAGCLQADRRVLTLAAFIVAGLLLSWFTLVEVAFPQTLRVGMPRNIRTSLILLADEQGLFKKRGVNVVIKEYESGAVAVKGLIEDNCDIAAAAEFVFVLQSSRYPSLRLSATISTSSDNSLVVRKDRAITRPQDLQGRRVAITRGTSAEFFFYNYLIFNHIPERSVRVIHMTPPEMIKAMSKGTIDAALSWSPHTFVMAKQLGENGVIWPAQSGTDYYFALVAKDIFLKQRSQTMELFLAALSDAETFITKYPERAEAILRKLLKADAESFHESWSNCRFKLQLTQDLLVLMERESKWAMRNNLIKKGETPNYLDFLFFETLEKVKPEAVSIVH